MLGTVDTVLPARAIDWPKTKNFPPKGETFYPFRSNLSTCIQKLDESSLLGQILKHADSKK